MSAEIDPSDWTRASELFLDLVELGAGEREVALARLRADDPALAATVEGLLAHDPGPDPPGVPATAPERFGPYVVVRRLGAGGMGEVFLARRDDGEFEREVAVKLLRPGTGGGDLAARFVRERQTLAALEHESIVRLLDGGTTEDGRPYLVMEYVEGVPLDAYVRSRGAGLRERLELFRQVLAAVAHAHGRGVVHRDLKPSNVLVRADGSVRLVDFGIARVLGTDLRPGPAEPLTRTGQRVFTPEYASPEQIRGERTTPATDVFALGVMLYELLADRSPWRRTGSTHDLEREILAAEPVPPSRAAHGTRARAVRGDLDTLCLACLARDPGRRYADAAALGEDLDRHLDGRTIQARRATALERGVRLVRRRPWQAAAGAATVALVAALAWGVRNRDLEHARQGELAQGLPGRLAAARLLLREGEMEAARGAMASALADIAELDEPGELEALGSMSRAALALAEGDLPLALELVEGVDTVLGPAAEGVGPAQARLRAELCYMRTNALAGLGRMDEAERAARSALELAEGSLEPAHHVRVGAAVVLGRVLVHTGRHGEARTLLAPLREVAASRGVEGDPLLAQVDGLLGRAVLGEGDAAGAVPHLEAALEALRWEHGAGHKDVAEAAAHLGEAYLAAGRTADARRTLADARRAYRALHDPVNRAFVLDLGSRAALADGDVDAAVECMEENLAGLAEGFPATRPQWCAVQYQLGWALVGQERFDRARAALEAALGIGAPADAATIAALGPGAEGPARATYGDVLDRQGDPAAAAAQYGRAAELFEGIGPQGAPYAERLRALARARTRD